MHVMGYVNAKDMRQNICTWKPKIRLLCMYVCVETYIYTYMYVCLVLQKAELSAVSPLYEN